MIEKNYLENIRKLFAYYRALGQKTIDQLNFEELQWHPDPDTNSISVIVKHLHGNMLSRWTDFLHSDGEKPWRNRDGEFEDSIKSKEELQRLWDEGWNCLFNAIEPLTTDDMDQISYIRNEGHSVVEAINRQLGHYAYHTGQIVFLGKSIKKSDWLALSIPKGQSEAYNKTKFEQDKKRKNFI